MIKSDRRYVSDGALPHSRTAVSASETCSESASASEYTAVRAMPSAAQVRNTRRAISPRLATRMFAITVAPALHPEDAIALRPLDRCVVDGGQAQAEHGAGVARVDDPVVVDHSGQEHRQRLGLDLLLDSRAHGG